MLDYLSGVGRGWGSAYAGIAFRKTQPQLRDVEKESIELIKPIWPTASYHQLKHVWTWRGGESLEFFHFNSIADFENIQGRQFAFIGFEELSLWENLEPYLRSFSCLRSVADPGMPRKIRATSNPLGPGHNQVKVRFRLRGVPEGICGPAIVDSRPEPPRRAIHGSYEENILLRRNEPTCMQNLAVSCKGDEARLQAWTKGNWDVVSGGAFDSIFLEHRQTIIVPPFELPASVRMFFSYDHGSSAPFSVGFWWESDGADIVMQGGIVKSTKRGDLFRVREIYGAKSGTLDIGTQAPIKEITKAIIAYKIERGWRYRDLQTGKWKDRCKRGVADTSIFDKLNEFSVATEFEKLAIINGERHPGIEFEPADKGPFSRRTGFLLMRQKLLATVVPREEPGLFVVNTCKAFLDTAPTLQRSDKDQDDVAENSIDHVYDETRYALRFDRSPTFTSRRIPGM